MLSCWGREHSADDCKSKRPDDCGLHAGKFELTFSLGVCRRSLKGGESLEDLSER